MKIVKSLLPAMIALAVMPFVFAPANAAVIDQGTITLDQSTGYQWLDMSFTTGRSYNYALGIAGTQFGGGWVVATRAEVLAFWTSATGVTSWSPNTWTVGLESAVTTLGGYVGYSYVFSNETSPGVFDIRNQIIGFDSGLINVDEVSLGATGFIDRNTDPAEGLVYAVDGAFHPDTALVNFGTWLVRGDGIRSAADVPEPSTLGFLGVGVLALGSFGAARRRRSVARTSNAR